ncbi:hypothetical protein EMGBS3_01630, partial [Anaerolineaceae bacterium]
MPEDLDGDPYEILNIASNTEPQVIEAVYRMLWRATTPACGQMHTLRGSCASRSGLTSYCAIPRAAKPMMPPAAA